MGGYFLRSKKDVIFSHEIRKKAGALPLTNGKINGKINNSIKGVKRICCATILKKN